jgi:hypothetical protein
MQSDGEPPHSQVSWAWMCGANAEDRITGSGTSKTGGLGHGQRKVGAKKMAGAFSRRPFFVEAYWK